MIELLLMNPATSCTPEQSFSTARRLKTWLSSTIRNRRFIFPSILNIHKGLTDEINLADVANESVSLPGSHYQYFGRFVASDFNQ